jgi:hypothetical protein
MSIPSWFSRSVGRVREGTKAHLVLTAELLNGSAGMLHTMRGATDEACEALLVDHVSQTCGGTVDWKEHPQDIAKVLAAFLSADDADRIRKTTLDERMKPPHAVHTFDRLLSGASHGVRAMDMLGDFYIVLVVPRDLLPRFDEINKHWIAPADA